MLLVSLGSTSGLRLADEQLCDALRAAGARVQLARAEPPRSVRTMALTDLAWARAARAATERALDERRTGDGRSARPPAVIYSSTTAALLWPLPGAIRFDACAAANRPGRHGLWQRPLERRRLAASTLLLPWSEASLRECPSTDAPRLLRIPTGGPGGGGALGARPARARPRRHHLRRQPPQEGPRPRPGGLAEGACQQRCRRAAGGGHRRTRAAQRRDRSAASR